MKKCFAGQCPNRPYADDLACYCHKLVKRDLMFDDLDATFLFWDTYGGGVLTKEVLDDAIERLFEAERKQEYLMWYH